MIPFRKHVQQTPATADTTPGAAFGRPAGATGDVAGVFEGKAVEAARQAAEAQKLGWLPLDTPERRQAAEGLKKGVWAAPGRLELGAIDAATLSRLQALAGGGGTTPTVEADEAAGGVVQAARDSLGEPSTTEANAASPGETPTARRAELWRELTDKWVVLAPSWEKREFAGFWEARIVGFDGDDVMLEWKDYEQSLPRFWLKRTQLALLHPDYTGKR